MIGGRTLGITVVVGALSACGAFGTTDATTTDGGAPSADGGGGGIASRDGASGSCPTGMVLAVNVCVDATEVTFGAYKQFLARGPLASSQSGVCSGNSSFDIRATDDNGGNCLQPGDSHPVVCIDWCDALTFCTAKGQRLCKKAEFVNACEGPNQYVYPYGNTHIDGACMENTGTNGTADVGAHPQCKSEGGIFDMVGNVREWIDDCDGSNNCTSLGGAAYDPVAENSCTASQPFARLHVGNLTGFRCCADPGK